MAATRTRSRSGRYTASGGGEIVVVNSAPAPRRSGGGGGRRRRRRGGGGRKRGGGSGKSYTTRLQNTALGGFGYGVLEKMFPNMPTIPMLGKSGTVAAACYFLKPKGQLMQDVGIAAAAIAGYTFGATGHVSGHGDDGGGMAR